MTSTDRWQVSRLINRLDQLVEGLNPLTLPARIAEAVHEVAVPPPGDPARMRQLADAFARAGADSSPVADRIHELGTRQLPDAWHGVASGAASRVVTATGDLVATARPAFESAAAGMRVYADAVDRLRDRHQVLHQRLHDVWRSIPDVHLFGLDLKLPDLAQLERLVATTLELLAGCQQVYRDSLDAADELARVMGDVSGKARSQQGWRGGLPAAEAVLVADTAIGAGLTDDAAILSGAQLQRAADRREALSPADRARLDGILAGASSPEERAYLLKAFAAGHSVDEIAAFDARIHNLSPAQLRTALSLVDPGSNGGVRFGNASITQLDETTCGSTTLLIARANADPLFAFSLTDGLDPSDPAGTQAFLDRLRKAEGDIHDATNHRQVGPVDVRVWPDQVGTSPWDMARWMNDNSDTFGTTYDWHNVDDTDSRDVNSALRGAVNAVDAGHPVPVLVGDGYPAHYVLIVGHEGNDLMIYEPGNGLVNRASEDDFLNGQMTGSTTWHHVQGVITPN